MVRKVTLAFFMLCLAGLLAVVFIVARLQTGTRAYRSADISKVPSYRVGLVFGASVRRDGSLSPILQDRVDGAVSLHRHGRVDKLLMTGDNGSRNYDEVTAMKRYAVAQGVPERDVVLDYAGFNTYDSCYRAKEIFGVQEAVLVTQRFHQARAVYTCRSLGINAFGLDLPDFEKYPNLRLATYARESMASVKAVWQISVTKPQPRLLGKREPTP